MFYFVNSILLIPNQLTDSFRKVINHSRQGLWWTCPRIHGSSGLGTDTSENETELTIHHTTLKSIKGKDSTFNPNIKLGGNKALWGCSATGRGRQIQSKQASNIRSKDLASSLKSTTERKPHTGLGRCSTAVNWFGCVCTALHNTQVAEVVLTAIGRRKCRNERGEQCLHQCTC